MKGGDKIKVNRVERHRIKKLNKYWKVIDNLCFKTKNLYNYANYIIRQEFISTTKEKELGLRDNANWLQYNELFKLIKNTDAYRDIGSNVGQATLRKLDKNWKSYFNSMKDRDKNRHKYKGMPRLPNYLPKDGRYELDIDNIKFRIKDEYIYFSWKPLNSLNNQFKTKISNDLKLMLCRFVPIANDYIMEIVYEVDVPDILNITEKIASIDLGINNLMTVTNNFGLAPFVINGKPLKSINQYYNKNLAKMKSDLKIKHNADWSNKLQRLTTKRNNKVEDYIHKASKMVIDYCLINNIDTLVCGYNQGWKQDSDMGKINNQKFVQIPYSNLVKKLEYKCENAGIIFKTENESYTSGTSFLDRETPVKENYNKERRKYRGLFVSDNGIEINADVNGSYQIMVKAFPKSFDDGIEGVDLHPIRVNLI